MRRMNRIARPNNIGILPGGRGPRRPSGRSLTDREHPDQEGEDHVAIYDNLLSHRLDWGSAGLRNHRESWTTGAPVVSADGRIDDGNVEVRILLASPVERHL